MPVDLLQSEVEVPRFDIKYLCAGIRQGLFSVSLAGLELRELSPEC